MRLLGGFLRISVGLVILVPGVIAGPAAAQAPVAMMTQTTVITGTETGKVAVELAQPAIIDFTPTEAGISSFNFSDHEGFAGLLITSAGDPGSPGTVMYLAMSLPAAFESLQEFTVAKADANTFCTICPLPAGRYNIYLLTREEVSLTLHVQGDGLSDETGWLSTSPTPADFLAPQPLEVGLPGDTFTYRSASASGQLEGRGTLINAYFLEGPSTEAVNVIARGSCAYSSEGPPNGVVTPGCLGGSHNLDGVTAAIQSPYAEGRMSMTYPLPAGSSSGLGVYTTTVGASGPFSFATIWLTF